jgi:hypothetical protein
MSGLKVRGRTQRTPSMEMPPGKLERAKPLARDQDVDFSSSDRPGARDFFTKGVTRRHDAAARTDHANQSARPRDRERPTHPTTAPPLQRIGGFTVIGGEGAAPVAAARAR